MSRHSPLLTSPAALPTAADPPSFVIRRGSGDSCPITLHRVTDRRPRVDVGIVVWNTRDLTLSAIARLETAADDVDLRVLVRDNGSTDGSADAIRAAFPHVTVTEGDNVGFARGVNSLLAISDAPWFVTLNSDAWPEPGALGRMVAAAEGAPRAAAVAPLLLRPDGELEHGTHPLPSIPVAAVTALHLE